MQKEVSVLDFLPKTEHAAISAGTSKYDCTSGIQAAINAANKVFVPPGIYLSKQLNLKSDLEFYGAGPSSELRAYDATLACQYLLATHVGSGGTSNAADNMRNISVHHLKLNGQVAEFGYQPFYYLLAVNATSDMTVQNVSFYGFRGDGMYVGSGTLHQTQRYNQRVNVHDCLFDGAVKNNRNGLSVIDCDGLTVASCIFQNIGNAKLSASVGGIDFEPDHDWSVYRNITIRNCTFRNIDSVNTAGITFHNIYQTSHNMHDWVVSDCQFDRCYWGIACASKPKTAADPVDNLSVLNCHFLNIVRTGVAINGLNGTQISGCTFEQSPPGAGPGGDAIRVGSTTSATSANAINAVITGNTFSGIRPQLGVIGVLGVHGLVCAGNIFKDIYGTCIGFSVEEAADTAGHIGVVVISGNTVTHTARLSGSPAANTIFLGAGQGMRVGSGNLQLDSSSFEYDNKLDVGIRRAANGTSIQFQGRVGQ